MSTERRTADLLREQVGLEIETAAIEGGERRIRGIANSFSVMRSGRMIHPSGLDKWLKRRGAQGVPLLAQHGYVRAGAYATVGRITGLDARREGLFFEARIASGTALADETWSLLEQRILTSLSIGWTGRRMTVRSTDRDLDAYVATKMKEAGVETVELYYDVDLAEISVVDVPDDAEARVAADAQAAAVGAAVEPLRRELAALRERVEQLTAGRVTIGEGAALDLRALFEGFVEQFEDAAFAALAESATITEEAAIVGDLHADLAHVAQREAADRQDDAKALRAMLYSSGGSQ